MKLPITLVLATLALVTGLRAEALHTTHVEVSSAAVVRENTSVPTVWVNRTDRSVAVALAVEVKALRRMTAHRTLEKCAVAETKPAGLWCAKVGRLVYLVKRGVTLNESAGRRTALLFGCEFAAAHSLSRRNWTAMLAMAW
jgi:hypothetical protein